MDRCPTTEMLRRLLKGLLSEGEAATLTEHVEICEHCPQVLDSLSDPSWDGPLPQLEGYEVLGELGHGGMGVVYKAWQSQLRRLVALKMIHSGVATAAEPLRRSRIEAEAVARMQHPNIVQIHGVGEHEGRPFLVLEFINGGSLAERLDKPWPARDAAALLEELAWAVHEAHQHGIIHRDLKPSNVLLPRGTLRPKVTDFGIAKLLDAGTEQTQTGQILGTPCYMAPEQAAGQSKLVGPATDVYGLGATLYELLTGRPPFEGESPAAVLEQVRSREPVWPRRLQKGVPRDLETVCLKCLAKEPHERYASADSLAEDLRRWRQGEPIAARRPGTGKRLLLWARRQPAAALAALLLVLLLAVGGVAGSFIGLWREVAWAKEQLQETNGQLEDANKKLDGANNKLTDANQQLGYQNYTHQISLADAYLLANEHGLTFQSLHNRSDHNRGWEWHYLVRRCAIRQTFPGSNELVSSRALSSDCKTLASASRDGTVTLRDVATGRVVWTLAAPVHAESTLAFSFDGKMLACGVGVEAETWMKYEVKIWNPVTGKELRTLPGSAGAVTSLAFSRDGERIACGLRVFDPKADDVRGQVKVWAVGTGEAIDTLSGHPGDVTSVAFSADGQYLASGSKANWHRGEVQYVLKLWEVSTGKVVHNLQAARNTAPADAERPLIRTLEDIGGRRGEILCLVFNPDGKTLASGCSDGSVSVWEVGTGRALHMRKDPNRPECIGYSPDGKVYVCGGRLEGRNGEGGLVIAESITGRMTQALKGLLPPSSVSFQADGKRFTTVSSDGTVKLWEPGTDDAARTLDGVSPLALSPDGRLLAGIVPVLDPVGKEVKGSEVKLWDVTTGQAVPILRALYFNYYARSASFSADRALFACVARRGEAKPGENWTDQVKLWDVRKGEEVGTFLRDGPIMSVAVSPDAKHLAFGVVKHEPGGTAWCWGEVELREVATGKLLHTLRQDLPVDGLTFSPDGKTLLVMTTANVERDKDGYKFTHIDIAGPMKLWDVTTGKEVRSFIPPGGMPFAFVGATGTAHGLPRDSRPTCVSFSPDGKLLACGKPSGGVDLWSVDTGNVVRTLREHRYVSSITFVPSEGRPHLDRLAAGLADGTVKLWDVNAAQELLTLRGHSEWVGGLAYNSRAGARLVSVSNRGATPFEAVQSTLRTWDGTPLLPEASKSAR